MKSQMYPALLALVVVAATFLVAVARADELPSFKKRGDQEKEFVQNVGTAIIRVARAAPGRIEMDSYEFEEVKKDRKNLKIVMNWVGGVTRKKYTSTIVLKIDSTDNEKWEVLNIDYSDTSISLANPNFAKMNDLIKKFNR